VGVVVLAACLVGAFTSPTQFFHSYLLGYLFWVGIGLGSLGILMLHHLVGGRWGYVIRRPLEAGTRTLPLLALLFLPLLAGMARLYPWARPEFVAGNELLQHKAAYLNVPFFITRAVLYFGLWMGMAYLLNRWSLAADEAGAHAPGNKFRNLSGPGLVVFSLSVSFAMIDWVMSLEPAWFSTIYGMVFIAGQVLATLCFMVPVVLFLSKGKPLSEAVSPRQFHNLGNLMLAFVMLWAYVSFSQYLIIWSGNLPEEITWYVNRSGQGWQWVALGLILFHFAVPFVLLLIRRNKQQPLILARIAVWLLVLRAVDLFWQEAPAFHGPEVRVHWMDPVVLLGLGGIWIAAFIWQLKKRPLLARWDPSLEEAVEQPTGA
jgi:hypothetical protein